MSLHLHLDLETYATFDISYGSAPYAEHPETEILLAAIAQGDEEPILWVHPKWVIPGLLETNPKALELIARLPHADTIYAHNAQFETDLMRSRGFEDMGCGPIPLHVWRCTAALGRKAGFRSKLAHLSEDLGLTNGKATASGNSLVPFFCTPTPSGKRRLLTDYPEKARAFADYCLQDVRAEQEVARRLKPFELKGLSLDTFQFTNRLNRRGIPVNVPALRAAQAIIEEVDADLGQQFYMATGLRHTQRDKVFHHLRSLGYTGEDMTADTVALQRAQAPEGSALKALLDVYSELAYAAAKKVGAMLNSVCADGTVKGTLLYHGAGTGRWSGRGIQPQNFKKPTIKGDLALAFEMVARGASREELEVCFGPALEVVASVIRNFIGPAGGCLDADYAAIEARIVNWAAGQEDVVELFRKGSDLYKRMGAIIYSMPEAAIGKSSKERQLGKQAVLGCGYGMGAPKFKETCLGYGIEVDDALAERAVKAYRNAHPRVTQFWKDLDRAAKDAVGSPGKWFIVGADVCRFTCTQIAGFTYLLMRLPSGRTVAYPKPEVKRVFKAEWNEFALELSYYGGLPGKAIMGRVKLYGGKICENLVQGIAADLMAHGALNADRQGFDIFALIHDQALAANTALGAEAFIAALTDLPGWAKGLPLKAEGDWAPYYRKD